MALRNMALDPRGLESTGPVFKTLILSLVSFSQTVLSTTFHPYLLRWPQQLEIYSNRILCFVIPLA